MLYYLSILNNKQMLNQFNFYWSLFLNLSSLVTEEDTYLKGNYKTLYNCFVKLL